MSSAGSRGKEDGMVFPIWDTREAGPRERKETAYVDWRQTSGCHTMLLRVPSEKLLCGEGYTKGEQAGIQGPLPLHLGFFSAFLHDDST